MVRWNTFWAKLVGYVYTVQGLLTWNAERRSTYLPTQLRNSVEQ